MLFISNKAFLPFTNTFKDNKNIWIMKKINKKAIKIKIKLKKKKELRRLSISPSIKAHIAMNWNGEIIIFPF